MSSPNNDPAAGSQAALNAVDGANLKAIVAGMSKRQRALTALWAYYECEQYGNRRIDWDGSEHHDDIDEFATVGYVPPGFWSAGAALPLKFRRPSAPYHLVKCIVNRFSGMLFSERQHPTISCEGDPDTEDWVTALAKASRFWAAWMMARKYGGAMGSVAVTFQFVNGRPLVEVHDPRWCTPEFEDLQNHELKSLEIRYAYSREVREGTKWREKWYWYRRVIDTQTDVVFQPVEFQRSGDEPEWVEAKSVKHALGFFPGVWVQNVPVNGEIDGDPDCKGIYEETNSIDSLVSQAHYAILNNLDPTVLIRTNAEVPALRKGSDNSIKVPVDSDAKYLETGLAGSETALSLAERERSWALEVAQCVLDHPDSAQRTATEVERTYASMLSQCDVLREQYGQHGAIPLCEKMVAAARIVGKARVETSAGSGEDGEAPAKPIKYELMLPPKVVKGADGTMTVSPRVLGDSVLPLDATWPPYFAPSLDDRSKATTAAVQAKAGGLLDSETAVRSIAPYYDVKDVQALVATLAQQAADASAQMQSSMFGGGAGGGEGDGGPFDAGGSGGSGFGGGGGGDAGEDEAYSASEPD
jgi:hypothetical protein